MSNLILIKDHLHILLIDINMIQERMLEFIILQDIIKKDVNIDKDKYNKKDIMKRYISLKKEFLEQYKK